MGGDHNGIDTIECGRIKVDHSAQPVAGRLDGLPKSIRATSNREASFFTGLGRAAIERYVWFGSEMGT